MAEPERFYRPDHNAECLNCAEWLDAHEHEPGCPAIADDESDYEFLDDAGRCVCRRPCPPESPDTAP